MNAVYGVIEVNLEVEIADIGIERCDIIGQLHGNPLMAGKRGEQPGLIVVGNDELVVGVGALFVNEPADELDSLAGRAALAKDDAGVDVFADACFGQGICGLCFVIHARAQRGRARNALLVNSRFGVGVPASVPLRRVVAHVAITICGLGRGVCEVGLV